MHLIASSPQQRALTTAQLLAAGASASPAPEDILILDGLRERNAGPWSGLTREDITEQYPNYLEDDLRPEGYESDASLLERTLLSLERVTAAALAGQPGTGEHPHTDRDINVLVLCHGGVINNLHIELGVEVGRVPNLSGRVIARIEAEGTDLPWRAEEQVWLLDEDQLTGGDANRV